MTFSQVDKVNGAGAADAAASEAAATGIGAASAADVRSAADAAAAAGASAADAPELDAIPDEDVFEVAGPDETGLMTCRFLAFNTRISLSAFGAESSCRAAFADALSASRRFERLFSRTLAHSDIARLNRASSRVVPIAPETADLLGKALSYCADSWGRFDVTMGAACALWDLRRGVVPSKEALDEALSHVNWRGLRVWEEDGRAFAQLDDPKAAVDAGGIAKGWIADALCELFERRGLESFLVNLGGNVAVRGKKPGGAAWNIGVQDPRDPSGIVGAMPLFDASAVTSGIYERCCTVDGKFYHHILSPETGMPAKTDVAGVTVVAKRSIDAEGYSTTLLALGTERGRAFVREHPAIERAIFVTTEGDVVEAE